MSAYPRRVAPGEPRLWRCGICGKVDHWDEKSWTWWGSYKHLDERGVPELVVCSPACKATAQERGYRDERRR